MKLKNGETFTSPAAPACRAFFFGKRSNISPTILFRSDFGFKGIQAVGLATYRPFHGKPAKTLGNTFFVLSLAHVL